MKKRTLKLFLFSLTLSLTCNTPSSSAAGGWLNTLTNVFVVWSMSYQQSTAEPYAWSKTIGGSGNDHTRSVIETSDEGLVVAGFTNSYGAGGDDMWLSKFNNNGMLQWSNTVGGSDRDFGQFVIETSDGGLVVAGGTYSYGFGLADMWLSKFNSSGVLQWSKAVGGVSYDDGLSAIETDGSHVVTGTTQSYGAGGIDLWLLKFSSSGGALQWAKTVGGSNHDYGRSVIETSDGSLVVTGYTESYSAGLRDMWLLKFNSDGVLQWSKVVGGNSDEQGRSVIETSDGSLVVTGYTESYDAGGYDLWLSKFNSSGMLQWSKVVGGSNRDYGHCIIETSDEGLVVAGFTNIYGAGGDDMWLLKFNNNGVLQWSKVVGGNSDEQGRSVIETSDGSLVVTGFTNSSYGAGGDDLFLLKFGSDGEGCGTFINPNVTDITSIVSSSFVSPTVTDINPTISSITPEISSIDPQESTLCTLTKAFKSNPYAWGRTVGGSGRDSGISVIGTSNGSLFVTGYTWSYGAGMRDLSLLKFRDSGRLDWYKTVGGNSEDVGASVIETSDGSLVVAGSTWSYGAGGRDLWLLKFNSSGTLEWSKTVGGSGDDHGYSVIETSDGSLVVTGYTASYGAGGRDLWLLKFGSSGALQWFKVVGGTGNDQGWSLIETGDGDLVVTGYTTSYGAGGEDLWLLKFNSSGVLEWSSAVGGSSSDRGYSIIETSDGSFVVTSRTENYGGAGGRDLWLSKFSSNGGALQWAKTVGGSNHDYGRSVIETSDGSLVVTGYTYSYGAGGSDLWLSKFSGSGDLQWSKVIGGSGNDFAYSLIETSDGGLVVTGSTFSYGAGGSDLWLLKFSSDGEGCGTFINPNVTDITSIVSSSFVSPAVTDINPIVSSITPEISSIDPQESTVCELTKAPTTEPTMDPTVDPTTDPTVDPTHSPTFSPTHAPTQPPTAAPNTLPVVIDIIEAQTVHINHAFVMQILTSSYFRDAEGDELFLGIAEEGKDTLPSWLNFDNATNTLRGTPQESDIGSYILRVIAKDGRGGQVSQLFSLAVEDDTQININNNNNISTSDDSGLSVADAAKIFGSIGGVLVTALVTLYGVRKSNQIKRKEKVRDFLLANQLDKAKAKCRAKRCGWFFRLSTKEYNKIKTKVEKKELEAALMLSNEEAVANIVRATDIPSKRLYQWQDYLSLYKGNQKDDAALLDFFKGKEDNEHTEERTHNIDVEEEKVEEEAGAANTTEMTEQETEMSPMLRKESPFQVEIEE